MKKIYFITAILILCMSSSPAQDDETTGSEVLKTKKGIPILPEVGDYAIGIDATPFFNYLGNMFSSSGNNNAPTFGFTAQHPGRIYGKYKYSSSTAYRASIIIGASTETMKEANGTDPDQTDKTTFSALTIGLIGGIEKNRQMFGRLVGIYGVQGGILKEPYTGNYMGSSYTGKISFKDGENSDNDFKVVGGNTWSLIAGGFVGVEFYFAPRMALAGEFGYDLKFSTTGERTLKPSQGDDQTVEYGGNEITLSPSASGNLQLLFYF